MEADAVATIVILIVLLLACGGAIAFLVYDRHKSKDDLKKAQHKLRDAKRNLTEYRTAAAASRTRIGLTYDAADDPHMRKLFEAVQELVDYYQGQGCAAVLAQLDNAVKEVMRELKSETVPCSSMKDGLMESLKEDEVVLPAKVMSTIDKILSIVMDELCDESGNINGPACAKFMKALTASLCG